MSKFCRVDLSTLLPCCVVTAQRRIQLAVTGDLLACGCGQKLEHRDGRWRIAQNEFRVQL